MKNPPQNTSYEVLALKWRPQNFNELVGQESVQRTLTNAIKQNRLYPVLIFTGPRGTGKTSTARIIAKTIRCLNRKEEMPCNTCEQCQLVQEGKNLDVIEIDGASNNGVDAIRELRDTINYLPSQGSRKIYIIDEVHMLSNSAFNALLKTLEEPPEHVLFIMATTEAHKIPQTVMSRAQRLDFHLINPLLIKEQLEKICKSENLPLDDQALWLIAKQAQGSLRDAQSLLDQMITFCGKDITAEKIIEILGLADLKIVFNCLESIIKRDEQKMLGVLKDIHSKGIVPKLILQELIVALRNLIVLKVNPDNKQNLIQTSQQEIDQLKDLISESSYEELHFLFDMLLKGEQELLFSSDGRMVLEILLLRFCQSPRLESITPFSFQNDSQNPIEENSKKKVKKSIEETTPVKAEEVTQPEPTPAKTEEVTKQTQPESIKKNDIFLFIDFIRKKNTALASVFENLKFKEYKNDQIVFIVPESFSYAKNKLQDEKNHHFLESSFNEFLKFNTKVSFCFEFSKEKLNTSLQKEREKQNQQQFLQNASEDSFVKEVTDIFDATITHKQK